MTVFSRTLVVAVLVGPLVSCSGDKGSTGNDATSPVVSSTDPADTATNVSVQIAPQVVFSEDVAGATTGTFTLSPSVAGTVSTAGGTVTFTPTSTLDHDTVYTATVTTGITDLAGNPQVANYSWTFTTAALPTVVSTSPLDGATKVKVIDSVVVTVSKSLDAGTISGTNVVLHTVNNVKAVPAIVAYNDTYKTITVKPRRPLSYGAKYALELTGITDLDGYALVFSGITFLTYLNPILQVVNYNSSTGLVSNCMANIINSDGTLQRSGNWSPGADNVCFTGDDVKGVYYGYLYDTTGYLTRAVTYSNADAVLGYSQYTNDALGNWTQIINYNGAGPNATWFNSDDVVQNWMSRTYDTGGHRLSDISFSAKGVDSTWFTADDTSAFYSVTTFDANGNLIHSDSYNGAGIDGQWRTSDDVRSGYADWTYDADGNAIALGTYSASGTLSQSTTWTYDTNEWMTEQTDYNAGGVAFSYDSYSYDTDGNQTEGRFMTPGTPDVMTGLLQYTFDANGNRLTYIRYTSAGSDGDWYLTADNKRDVKYIYDPTH